MTAPQPVSFGRYRLSSLLGKGAMATVYRAVLPGPMGFEKDVAVKRIHGQLTEDQRFVQALVNEARLGGQLRHKNIVEIYEFDEVDGQYFLAMEYVDGWTLRQVLRVCRDRQEHIPLPAVLSILEQICEGLDYAHTAIGRDGRPLNLVHRDLKPANIMLSRQGDAKIMDFGIAKADSNLYETGSSDLTKGTPIYMSPEQVCGESLDARSDIFSLGSILYELVTLKRRFQAENLLSVMHAVLHSDTSELLADLPREASPLVPVLRRCMAPEPSERYSSARDLRRGLMNLHGEVPMYPSAAEWITSMVSALPEPLAPGDFGREGAPSSVAAMTATAPLQSREAEGTQSLAEADRLLQSQTDEDGLLGEDEDAQETPRPAPAEEGSGAAWTASPDGPGDESPGGATTLVLGDLETKVMRPVARSPQARLTPLEVFLGLLMTLLLAGVLMWAFYTEPPEPPAEPRPLDPARATEPGDAAASATPSQPGAAAVPPPDKAATAGEDVEAGSEAAEPADGPSAVRDGRSETSAAAEQGPPLLGVGAVSFDSVPPASVFVDGQHVGFTPIDGLELLAGDYLVLFDCSNCSPAQQRRVPITVVSGEPLSTAVRFDGRRR